MLQAKSNVITVRLGNEALANHRGEGDAISVADNTNISIHLVKLVIWAWVG